MRFPNFPVCFFFFTVFNVLLLYFLKKLPSCFLANFVDKVSFLKMELFVRLSCETTTVYFISYVSYKTLQISLFTVHSSPFSLTLKIKFNVITILLTINSKWSGTEFTIHTRILTRLEAKSTKKLMANKSKNHNQQPFN